MTRYGEAIILAGGFGTRLSHVVADVPKPMAPVVNRPFLSFLLDQLSDANFDHIVIADGYKREVIEDYFGDSYRGLRIEYSSEAEPLLTGGAVKQALSLCQDEWVLVINGDSFFDIDLSKVLDQRTTSPDDALALIAVKQLTNFDRYGAVEIAKDSRIARFKEKNTCSEGCINAGVYLVRRSALNAMPRVFSLEQDWFPAVAKKGELVALVLNGDFIDIGIPSDYEKAQCFFAERAQENNLALFDRDGTINVEIGYLHEPEKVILIESTVNKIRAFNELGWKVVAVSNQAGIARGIYSENDMRKTNLRIDALLEERGAHVDAWYYCPHHPDYTGVCDCRKPAAGMIVRTMKEWGANPENCIMYGDSPCDELAAKNAGIAFRKV